MNATALFRFLLAGILALLPVLAIAQSSANFKSPAFAVNAGVGDMASSGFSARASVGQPFSPAALSSANFAVTTGLLAIPLASGTTGNLSVFNTGVAADRTLLPGGSVDPHYTLIASAEPSLPGPNAIVTSQIADGFWIAQGPDSKWIAPSANQSYPGATPCNAAGTYTYRTLVDLTGFDPATAVIQGKWAVDNQGTAIRLNGVSIGATAGGYNPFYLFTINSGFIAGVNTLDFVTADQGCPNGLRVELSGTATFSAGVPGAPTINSTVAGNSQVTIDFSAPANNGGSAITSYTATCSSLGRPDAINAATVSPITVSGLVNFVGYSCSVIATNAAGNSPASVSVVVIPVDPPVIISSTTAMGTVGQQFDYVILSPTVATSFAVNGTLPNGVSLNPTTGRISGTPTQPGIFNITLFATNGAGTGTGTLTITIAGEIIAFNGVVSRKNHGAAGPFDIVLDPNTPIDGAIDVEPRAIGAGHLLVFQFDNAIFGTADFTVRDAAGQDVGAIVNPAIIGHTIELTLTGIPDNKRVKVTLNGINGTTTASASIGFLVGDVNNSRNVNAQDIAGIKARAGQITTAGNFRHDITASGRITAADVVASKVLSGNALP